MLNKIMLIGNLGRDPELQVTSDGTPFTRFSLAVSRTYTTTSGERRDETEWFNVVAWRNLAEVCERYLHKGSKVYLEGRVTQRRYTDKNGQERTSVEVNATEMEMLTPKAAAGSAEGYAAGSVSGDERDPFLPDYPDDLS